MAGGSEDRTVVVSAPGKVLLAGGYIVLDRKHTGLVFGLSARIHVLAQEIHTSAGVHLSEIVVQSPQFLNATWRYGYHLVKNGGGIKVTQLQSGTPVEPNHFVETTLNYVLSYISEADKSRASHGFQPASLLVLADNDYYSKPKPPSSTDRPSSSSSAGEHLPSGASEDKASLSDPSPSTTATAAAAAAAAADAPAKPHRSRPRFRHFGTTLRDAHKTGLGSSAAIVTALTASLLAHYLPHSRFDPSTAQGRRVLHNLAQVAHCSAQGKIGSGFDVASAVYGSCLYRRFSPALLSGLPSPGEEGFAPALAALVDDEGPEPRWDCEIRKDDVGLPPGLAIRMCDVDCGTQTVSMVKKVHEWRDREPDAARAAYERLQGRVDELAAALSAGRVAEVGRVMSSFRAAMRSMGKDCGAPIEPESQEELLDALEKVDGVLGTVVPGAGGYDAAAVVMRDDAETEKRVQGFLRKWSIEHEIQVRLMKVRGETEGVRMEDVGEFKSWVS
ncbi:hypothetical protein VTH06DRAFT_2492 [Thermothelomyces fergusii]